MLIVRRKILDAVRQFDRGAALEGRVIRLTDGATLPNERRALRWILASYQTYHARTRREAAQVDPELAQALDVLEREFGSVTVLEVRPNGD